MANSRRTPRRILHTSDLHLEKLNDAACQSLQRVVELSSQARVDLVVVAGDLFDNNRIEDDLVSFAVEQLRQTPVSVVILPGNHDCLVPDSVFEREELWENCTNVQVFRAPGGEIFGFPEPRISLWGRCIDSYELDVLPLAGIPQPRSDGYWHIAVAHGYYIGSEIYGSTDDNEVEAPLFPSYHITEKEIATSGWDYIALGHLITFGPVNDGPVKAYYSGSPSLTDSAAIVDFTEENGVQVTRYSFSKKQYVKGE